MADDRTTITEVATGLGMLGYPGPTMGLRARPEELVGVDDGAWERLSRLHWARTHEPSFRAAFANGRAFLDAGDGLRGRRPALIEWKGTHRQPGDEVAPVDLRVDHVYLVSCKYLSRVLINAAPAHVFDRLLTGGHGRRGPDWFAEVAPAEYHALYSAARTWVGDASLPAAPSELRPEDRAVLKGALRARWPAALRSGYRALCQAVASASAERWAAAMAAEGVREEMLWRLLRIGSAPYYVLGTAPARSLRLRIATPWDWRQRFVLRRFSVFPQSGGQARVGWTAAVLDRRSREVTAVDGHVEIRWSHGRFCGPPEAKVYLDTPHHRVPGYFPLGAAAGAATAEPELALGAGPPTARLL